MTNVELSQLANGYAARILAYSSRNKDQNDDILRYILDEKEIECFLTGVGVPFYDMRRTNRLQPATLLHFPVPCTVLETMGLPHYTIHAMADGVEGSAGNWTGWDE